MRTFTLLLILLTLLKANAQQWEWTQKSERASKKWDLGHAVCTDFNGNAIVTGTFQDSAIRFGPITLTNSGSQDIFIVKYDIAGNIKWAKSVPGPLAEYPKCIASDNNGNIYVGGLSDDTSFWFANCLVKAKSFFVLKLDSSGNKIWAKSGTTSGWSAATAITCNNTGQIFVTGYFTSSMTVDSTLLENNGAGDIFVLKFNSEGELLWHHTVGGNWYDYPTAIKLDASGSIIVTGHFQSKSMVFGQDTLYNIPADTYTFKSNLFVLKYSQSGSPVWAKGACGKFSNSNEVAYDLVTDKYNNMYITGNFEDWKFIYDKQVTIGETSSNNVFLLKLNANGILQWINYKKHDEDCGGLAYSLAIDNAGYMYLAGSFYGAGFRFDNYSFTTNGGYDDFIYVFNPAGQVQFATSFGSNRDEAMCSITLSKTNEMYFTGGFQGKSLAIGSEMMMNSDTTGSSMDMFISKMSFSTIISVKENVYNNEFETLYPNPTSGKFTVNENISAIYDVLGNTVSFQTNATSTEIDLSDKPKGIYFVEIKKEEVKIVKKVILE